jgi:hypothetical protein
MIAVQKLCQRIERILAKDREETHVFAATKTVQILPSFYQATAEVLVQDIHNMCIDLRVDTEIIPSVIERCVRAWPFDESKIADDQPELRVFVTTLAKADRIQSGPSWPFDVSFAEAMAMFQRYREKKVTSEKNTISGESSPSVVETSQELAFSTPTKEPARRFQKDLKYMLPPTKVLALDLNAKQLKQLFEQWNWFKAALIASAEKEIESDRKKSILAVDASVAHQSWISSWKKTPRDHETGNALPRSVSTLATSRISLLSEEGKIIADIQAGSLKDDAILHGVRSLLGTIGIRHWCGILVLLSIDGGRSGHVVWNLERHLEILGYSDRTHYNTEKRKEAVDILAALTKIQLAVYAPNGELRMRRPILMPEGWIDRKESDGSWSLEGSMLMIHPLLYEGVRNPTTQEIGTNWFPTSPQLAKIDHVRFRYAHVLGLTLAGRMRLAMNEQREYVRLSGKNLLALAGVELDNDHPQRPWMAIQRDLKELQDQKCLGEIHWEGEPWTELGICLVYPPQWTRDRIVHKVAPLEPFPKLIPSTGTEFIAWRKQKGWTQIEAAKWLKVGERTIRRAEYHTDARLPKRMLEALKNISNLL